MSASYQRDVDGLAQLELLERSDRRRREPFFQSHWLDLATGERTRATRAELLEAYRLLAKHRDLWER